MASCRRKLKQSFLGQWLLHAMKMTSFHHTSYSSYLILKLCLPFEDDGERREDEEGGEGREDDEGMRFQAARHYVTHEDCISGDGQLYDYQTSDDHRLLHHLFPSHHHHFPIPIPIPSSSSLDWVTTDLEVLSASA